MSPVLVPLLVPLKVPLCVARLPRPRLARPVVASRPVLPPSHRSRSVNAVFQLAWLVSSGRL